MSADDFVIPSDAKQSSQGVQEYLTMWINSRIVEVDDVVQSTAPTVEMSATSENQPSSYVSIFLNQMKS